MKPYTLKIEAGTTEVPSIVGNYVRLGSIVGASALTVRTSADDEVVLSAGDWAKLHAFTWLRLNHDGVGEATIILEVGNDTEAGSAQVNGDISIVSGTRAVALDDLVIAAGDVGSVLQNDLRKEVHVFNSGNEIVRWGSTLFSPGPFSGGVIPPGVVGVIPVSGEIRFFNPSANPVTLYMSEVQK